MKRKVETTPPMGLYRLALGLFAQIAATPALWHLTAIQDHRSGAADLAQESMLVAIAGVLASVVAAGLLILPGPKFWFLRRREGQGARFVSSLARMVFALAVLAHFLVTFNRFEFMSGIASTSAIVAAGLAGLFILAFVFPGTLATQYTLEGRGGPSVFNARAMRQSLQSEKEEPMTIYRVEKGVSSDLNDLRPYLRTDSAVAQMAAAAAPDRRGANLYRPFFLFIVFGVFALGVYGEGYAWFAPNVELVEWWRGNDAWVFVGALIFVILSIPFLPKARNRVLGNGIVRVALFGSIYAMVLLSFLPSAALKGGPGLFSLFEQRGEIVEADVLIVRKEPFTARRRCDGAFEAVGNDVLGGEPLRVCGADEFTYNALSPGERATLRGRRSVFGVRYQTVRPAG